MEEVIIAISTFVTTAYGAVQGSMFFFLFKILAALYTVTLLMDVILLIYLGDIRKRYRQLRRGTGAVTVTQHAIDKRWKKIHARLDGGDEDEWKIAVLEADRLIDDELTRQGYHGDNFPERLLQIPTHAFSNLQEVRDAHNVRNHIIRDQEYDITHEEAQEAVEAFEEFLEDLGVGMV